VPGLRSFGPPQLGRGVLGASRRPLNIVLHGNSLFTSVGAKLAALLPASATVFEEVEGGARTTTLHSNFSTAVNAHKITNKRNIVALWELHDDINDFGETAATAYNAYAAYIATAIAAGWEPWAVNCIDTTEFDAPDARAQARLDVNTLLRASPAGAAKLIDLAALPQFDPTLDAATTGNGTIYSGDGIHILSAGQDIVAAQLALRAG
jgi:hypothetical protein